MRRKFKFSLVLSVFVATLLLCVFQLVGWYHKEAAIARWQAAIAASNLFGQRPDAVIAFLDFHHLPHSAYEKAPYRVYPSSPGHDIKLDRRIFVEFGPVAQTFDVNQGYSNWYIVTDFNFAYNDKLGGWTMTASPKKVRDGEILCCTAIPPYGPS